MFVTPGETRGDGPSRRDVVIYPTHLEKGLGGVWGTRVNDVLRLIT